MPTIDWRWVIGGLLCLAAFSFLIGYVTGRLDERDAIRHMLLGSDMGRVSRSDAPMNHAATRAKALRDQAHSLYLKAVEFKVAAYALEQEALRVMRESVRRGIDGSKPCARCAD